MTTTRPIPTVPNQKQNPIHPLAYDGTVRTALAAVRRELKRAGIPLGKVLGRYTCFGPERQRIEGITVHRIGCSTTIALDFIEGKRSVGSTALRAKRFEHLAAARAVLLARGFPFDDRGWMECQYN